MTRIRQFANDMGISYNKAKGLINKGKKRRDGGSTILEKFTMPIVIKEKKKLKVDKPKRRPKKEEPKGGGPLMTPGQKKLLDKQTGKGKPEEAKSGKFMKAADGKITKLRKKTSNKAKMGNFKNIVNASVSGKITPEEAEKRIRKLVITKAMGGINSGLQTPSRKIRRKEGGATEFGMLSVKAGIDNNPNPTQADRIAGATKGEKKKRGGTIGNSVKMRLGGVARGGGAAIQGTGFKGVY